MATCLCLISSRPDRIAVVGQMARAAAGFEIIRDGETPAWVAARAVDVSTFAPGRGA